MTEITLKQSLIDSNTTKENLETIINYFLKGQKEDMIRALKNERIKKLEEIYKGENELNIIDYLLNYFKKEEIKWIKKQ